MCNRLTDVRLKEAAVQMQERIVLDGIVKRS